MASFDKKPDEKCIKYELSTFAQNPNGFRDYVTFTQVKNVLYPELFFFCLNGKCKQIDPYYFRGT